jgi:hypothetical protein
MAKEIPEHKDILGRVLNVGDHVAYPDSNSLRLGKIDKLNQKMVRITTGKEWRSTVNKYPIDTVKLDGPDLVMYLLKK